MKLDLGFAKIPFEGDYNFAIAFGGIGNGILWTTLVFCLSEVKGPAVYQLGVTEVGKAVGEKFIDACGKTLIVTAFWCFLYYNYVGVQVQAVFNPLLEFFARDDVTEKYAPNAARFSGNMFEQAPVFLVLLWSYTLFVDYETGGYLGILYMIKRLIYPWLYMILRRFTFWFEFVTQIGYGINGVYMLGVFMNGLGGGNEFGKFAKDNPVLAAIIGFVIGSFAVFPYGNPISIIYGVIHYKCDRRAKLAEVTKAIEVP